MSARLNIQIIQQQPLNTLLLSSHRAATVLLRQLSAGDLFLAAKWFRSCCNSSNALCSSTRVGCAQFQWSTGSALCATLHWWWWNCCCMQWRKVYTGLGFVGSTWAVSPAGGRSHCTFPASQPCTSTSPCSTSPPCSCCLLHMHHMDS